MKKTLATVLTILGLTLVAPAVTFAYGGNQTNPAACTGKVVVNVNYDMLNDTDSAVGGGTWANDTINRHLQVMQVSDGMYCATVSDGGKFVTFDSNSPNATGTVSAGVTGNISGGYSTPVFAGSLLANPAYKTHGNLGAFDLQCDRNQNCPGVRPSVSSFVSGWNGNLGWWGWQYQTAQNGTWVNSVDGNTGDITS